MHPDRHLLEPITAPKVCGQCRAWSAFVDGSGWGKCARSPEVREQSLREHYACQEFQDRGRYEA